MAVGKRVSDQYHIIIFFLRLSWSLYDCHRQNLIELHLISKTVVPAAPFLPMQQLCSQVLLRWMVHIIYIYI